MLTIRKNFGRGNVLTEEDEKLVASFLACEDLSADTDVLSSKNMTAELNKRSQDVQSKVNNIKIQLKDPKRSKKNKSVSQRNV